MPRFATLLSFAWNQEGSITHYFAPFSASPENIPNSTCPTFASVSKMTPFPTKHTSMLEDGLPGPPTLWAGPNHLGFRPPGTQTLQLGHKPRTTLPSQNSAPLVVDLVCLGQKFANLKAMALTATDAVVRMRMVNPGGRPSIGLCSLCRWLGNCLGRVFGDVVIVGMWVSGGRVNVFLMI